MTKPAGSRIWTRREWMAYTAAGAVASQLPAGEAFGQAAAPDDSRPIDPADFARADQIIANAQFRPCVELGPGDNSFGTAGQLRVAPTPQARANATLDSARLAASLNSSNSLTGDVEFAEAGLRQVASGQSVDTGRVPASFSISQSNPGLQDGRVFDGIVARLKLWSRDRPPTYSFIGGEQRHRDLVVRAFAEWKQWTCLDFRPGGFNADIRISFVSGRGHYSLIGTDCSNRQFSPNGSGQGESTNIDVRDPFSSLYGTILHELGHAIGFAHEHQNPEQGLKWREELAYAYFARTQGWNRSKTFANVIDKLSNPREYALTPRDRKSIMHYFFPRELLLDNQDVPVLANQQLSPVDKSFAQRQYGCSGGRNTESETAEKEPIDEKEEVVVEKSAREKLSTASAITLEKSDVGSDRSRSNEFRARGELHLYELNIGEAAEYEIATLPDSPTAAWLEVHRAAPFSIDRAIAISQPGSAGKILQGYVKVRLDPGKYYVVAGAFDHRAVGPYRVQFARADKKLIKNPWDDFVKGIEKSQSNVSAIQKEIREKQDKFFQF